MDVVTCGSSRNSVEHIFSGQSLLMARLHVNFQLAVFPVIATAQTSMASQFCQARLKRLSHYCIHYQKAVFTIDRLRRNNVSKGYCNNMQFPDLASRSLGSARSWHRADSDAHMHVRPNRSKEYILAEVPANLSSRNASLPSKESRQSGTASSLASSHQSLARIETSPARLGLRI